MSCAARRFGETGLHDAITDSVAPTRGGGVNAGLSILVMIACVLALVLILFALVAISKVRRDRTERASAAFRIDFLEAWNSGEADRIREPMAAAAESIAAQADLLAALRSCERASPDATVIAVAQAAAHESMLLAVLLDQLTAPDAVHRGLAVWLGGLRTTRLPTSMLAALLADPDPTVRLATVGALEAHANADAVAALIAALEDGHLDPPRIIERLGHAWAVPMITDRIPKEPDRVQAHLSEALGLASDPRAIDILSALVHPDRASGVRTAAARALVRCAPDASVEQKHHLRIWAQGASRDPVPMIRASAIRIMAVPGMPTDIDLISSALGDPDWFVRRSAAQALVTLGPHGLERLEEVAAGTDAFAAARARQELALASHVRRVGGGGA